MRTNNPESGLSRDGQIPWNQHVELIQWGPAVAGALTAAAIGFVLNSFGTAIGLALSSTAPTWRDSSLMLQSLSGLYLVLVAITAFGVGGYLAGRLRTPMEGTDDDLEFRDGSTGLLVWAIAMVLTVLMVAAAALSIQRAASPGGGSVGATQSIAGENLIAFDLDRLFRAEQRPPQSDVAYARSEAARILLTSSSHVGVLPDDRAHLIRIAAANADLQPAEAERRADIAIAQARDNIRKARRAGVVLAFMAGAAALLGAAVSWYAACAGGEHRDGRTLPPAYLRSRARKPAPTRPINPF
jgi:hypothetical protein